MSRALNDLSPACRPLVVEFLARLAEAGIPILIVETLRTAAQQAANLANGSSWIVHSKHLDGNAIDVAPYETFAQHGPDKLNWDAGDPIWTRIGLIGEACGLKWGGRWTQKDMGHFELP